MENNIIPAVEAKSYYNNYEVTINGQKSTLKRDVDFGMIYKADGTPITNKPTLFASGKDKILHGMGLIYLTEIVESHYDMVNATFYYMAKSTAYYNDKPVRTAYGCANSSEKSGGKASGYDLANTACKKAVKRAEVALAIKLANLGDMFVQDIEDTKLEEQANNLMHDTDPITQKQVKRIFAIASTNGITIEEAKKLLASWGYESTKSTTQAQYDEVCEKLERYGKGE